MNNDKTLHKPFVLSRRTEYGLVLATRISAHTDPSLRQQENPFVNMHHNDKGLHSLLKTIGSQENAPKRFWDLDSFRSWLRPACDERFAATE